MEKHAVNELVKSLIDRQLVVDVLRLVVMVVNFLKTVHMLLNQGSHDLPRKECIADAIVEHFS